MGEYAKFCFLSQFCFNQESETTFMGNFLMYYITKVVSILQLKQNESILKEKHYRKYVIGSEI